MIRDDKHSCKEEIIREVHRILLAYEERLAKLEEEQLRVFEEIRRLKSKAEELDDYVEALESDVTNKIREVSG